MEVSFIGSVQCLTAQIHYYLLSEQISEGMQYGVRAELEGEEMELPALSSSQERVQELLEVLMRGQVTPAALRDVVEDWLLI